MNLVEIEKNIKKILEIIQDNKEKFIYELLRCYGIPKASVTKLEKGNLNISRNKDDILWKNKLYFKESKDTDIYETFLNVSKDEEILKNKPRFVIITNYQRLLSIDTLTSETLYINIIDIDKYYTFFLPWAGMEKAILQKENPADVKAADSMMKLYDEIKKDNKYTSEEEIHELNIFIARLLFCFFAEDTEIFEKKIFTKSIISHTQSDGSDLNKYLGRVFSILDDETREGCPEYLNKFPYVGGGLFNNNPITLKFNSKSRQLIIENGQLDWSSINPDIFGSMIQTVINPNERSNFGMHYTSVPNIMRVLNPLFLDEFNNDFENNKENMNELNKILYKLSKIKVFDPACGSGNFLIIAYKEIRKLEMQILDQINKINNQQSLRASNISINQFFGIEKGDFAHEIASLSLWLIEHKMNMEFYSKFNYRNPALPLKPYKNIVHGNSTRISWGDVCPQDNDSMIFIIGNPPYVGSKKQSKEQKKDMEYVFKGIKGYKNLDYVSCWFFIGYKYMREKNVKLAFVSTDSIVQGDQVGLLWCNILKDNIEIGFAHTSFKWNNNASNSAGVSCVIIGLQNKNNRQKMLIGNGFKKSVNIISPYLTADTSTIVIKRTTPLSKLPQMCYGNMPLEGGFLKLTNEEKIAIEKDDSRASKFIRPVIGGDEFLKGYERYCLWIEDDDLEEAMNIDEIKNRIEKVYQFRVDGGEVARTLALKSHQFRYRKVAKQNFIIIPRTSSEKRDYLQCGLYDKKYISLESAQVINDCEIYVFGILSSKLHMLWTKATCGCLESRIRYSTQICYNTFPIPELGEKVKKNIEECVFNILYIREKYSEKTIGQLYDQGKMPKDLKEAHENLDIIIEKCYKSKSFKSDEERLECLFSLYEKMINE